MKKIIITCFLLINIWPCILDNDVKISCTNVTAQRHYGTPCSDPSDPGVTVFAKLGTWIGKAFTTIRGFFAGPEGDEPAGEGFGFASEESWADFCDSELFQDEDLDEYEEEVLNDLPEMLKVYNANKDDPDRYYLTLAGSPNHRFYNTAKMSIQQSSTPVKIILHRENGPLNVPAVEWDRNNIPKCPQSDTCSFLPSTLGETDQIVKVNNAIKLRNLIIVEEAPKYYVTLQGYPKKYYEGDSIFVPIQRQQVKLYVHYEGGAVNTSGLAWKRNDTVKCNTINNCLFAATQMGVTTIKVDSGNNVLLTKNPLVVYKQPTLYFKRGFNYDGEYGFDDSTHQYLNIRNANNFKNGYEVKHIMDDPNYFVPWMSLLHNQQSVNILDSFANFSNWAKKDVNAYVEFKATSNKISLNPIKHFYNSSGVINSLNIVAQQWTSQLDSIRLEAKYDSLLYPQLLKSVYAVTNTGDTIGKLNWSCSSPSKKKIVFVYVNTGQGYDSTMYKKINMINQLNLHSHNQLFREWVLDNSFSDTLDLTSEYANNSASFKYNNVDSMPEKMVLLYKAHKNINIFTINQFNNLENFIRFSFVTNLTMAQDTLNLSTNLLDTVSFVRGITGPNFAHYSVLFKDPLLYPLTKVTHEFLHMLKADHTWEIPYLVPEKTTKNIMDYTPKNGTRKKNELWYGQWIKIF